MTRQHALAVARERVEIMAARLPPGAQVRLALFEDEATYLFLKGHADWPFAFHGMVIRACAREFKRRGFPVQLKTICLPEYYDWLIQHQLTDSPAHRAKYISF